jgi:hypothetical protein
LYDCIEHTEGAGKLAKSTKGRLKVFQAQFGFFETVVAAPSRAAALRAWGTHQDLFARGAASVTTDAAAIQAAIAHPETPLRRAVGSRDVFALEPASLPKLPAGLKKARKTPRREAQPKTPSKPKPNRSRLNDAEKALRLLEKRRTREEAELSRQADDLEARRQAAQATYAAARKEASAALAAARRAYKEAGGED